MANQGTWKIERRADGFEVSFKRRSDGAVASCGLTSSEVTLRQVEEWVASQVTPGDLIVDVNGVLLPVLQPVSDAKPRPFSFGTAIFQVV